MAEAISMNIGGNDYNIKDSVARAQLDLVKKKFN